MTQQEIVVREWDGRPVHRRAVDVGDRVVFVSSFDGGDAVTPIGVPESDVFLYDREAFELLITEWKVNRNTSDRTWGKLDRFSWNK